MATAATIQAKINAGAGKAAKVLGTTYNIIRPNGATDLTNLNSFKIGSLLAAFTNAKASGFNFTKGQGFDDYLWNVLADATGLIPGDFLVETQPPQGSPVDIYYIVDNQVLGTAAAVLCPRTVTHLRRNSEIGGNAQPSGGTGHYYGPTPKPQPTSTGAGETTLAKNVPCALVALAGRATGVGEVPSDAPGPARWRAYLPPSAFPFGSVKDRDILVDDQGARYMVNADGWTPLGYRPEMIRLEN